MLHGTLRFWGKDGDLNVPCCMEHSMLNCRIEETLLHSVLDGAFGVVLGLVGGD